MPSKDGYYEMMFTCSNCEYIFKAEVERGTPAKGNGGECPHCGVRDGHNGLNNFSFSRQLLPPEFNLAEQALARANSDNCCCYDNLKICMGH